MTVEQEARLREQAMADYLNEVIEADEDCQIDIYFDEFLDRYCGQWDTMQDFVKDYYYATNPKLMQQIVDGQITIDWQQTTKDFEASGYTMTRRHHVFRLF